VPPEKLDPGDDDRSAPDHCVERLQGLLLAEPRDLFDQELKIGLDRTEIDVLGIPSWHRGMVIVWHGIDHARSWLTVGYDEKRWFGNIKGRAMIISIAILIMSYVFGEQPL